MKPSKRKPKDSLSEGKIGRPRNKHKRTTKPEPEYFEDKRYLEDLWRFVLPIGTEWDKLDKIYEFDWKFSNLEKAFEENGVLHGKKVYLFGLSEEQEMALNGEYTLIIFPVIVAVVSQIIPSEMIGIITSKNTEQTVPMKDMKMGWVPYTPPENRDGRLGGFDSQIFILSCHQRRAALKHLKMDRQKAFESCMPHLENPLLAIKKSSFSEIQIEYPIEPTPLFYGFDWVHHNLEEVTIGLIVEERLSEEHEDVFKEFVKEKVREAKRKIREDKEELEKQIQEMSEEVRNRFEEMRFYKFYPVDSENTPPFYKQDSYINYYYVRAHEVF